MDETKVYEIDVTKKYIIAFDEPLSMLEQERLMNNIDHWLKSAQPFLILHGNVKLVHVENEEREGNKNG